MSDTTNHPTQPIYVDVDSDKPRGPHLRFKPNPIIRDLLEKARVNDFGLNEIAKGAGYTEDDFNQLLQLLGYSVEGFRDGSAAREKIALTAKTEYDEHHHMRQTHWR